VRLSYAEFRDCEWCRFEYWADVPTRQFCSIRCRTASRWSVYDDRIARWRQEYLRGDSYKSIADREGLAPNTVRGALQYAGVEPRKRWDRAVELNTIKYAQEVFQFQGNSNG